MAKLDLVGTVEIRVRLGVSKARVHQLVREKGFPEPVRSSPASGSGQRADVEAWIAAHRPPKEPHG
jgi:prophage regulatory protein